MRFLKGKKKDTTFIFIIGLAVTVLAIACAAFTLLWNWLMPELFNLPELTYFQGVGLLILSKFLLGGIGASANKSSNNKQHKKESESFIKQTVQEELKKQEPVVQPFTSMDNDNADKLFEMWWEDEGEKYFENYLTENLES